MSNETWNCPNCGKQEITVDSCPDCGTKKPKAKKITPEEMRSHQRPDPELARRRRELREKLLGVKSTPEIESDGVVPSDGEIESSDGQKEKKARQLTPEEMEDILRREKLIRDIRPGRIVPIDKFEIPVKVKGEIFLKFGSYEQDNYIEAGKEPIEWKVLAIKGERMLVLSVRGLDAPRFNPRDCSGSEIRSWLNETFADSAFTSAEKSRMAPFNDLYDRNSRNTGDLVSLLSASEVTEYFPKESDRIVYPTRYAKALGAETYSGSENEAINGAGRWWLQSYRKVNYDGTIKGYSDNYPVIAIPRGKIIGVPDDYDYVGSSDAGCMVRPVLWLKISNLQIAAGNTLYKILDDKVLQNTESESSDKPKDKSDKIVLSVEEIEEKLKKEIERREDLLRGLQSMLLVVTDTGKIWNHENPFLEKYKERVLVVCLNGEKVTDKYECFVSPVPLDVKREILRILRRGLSNMIPKELDSVREELCNKFKSCKDIVFLTDDEESSLYPYYIAREYLSHSKSADYNIHLVASAPSKHHIIPVGSASSKHHLKSFTLEYNMLSDLSYVSSIAYYAGLDKASKTKEELGKMMPYLLDIPRDKNCRYYFDFTAMKYKSIDEGFEMVERQVARIDGKQVCNLLRKQRIMLAEANNIPFESEDCPSTGACAGTCPKCDHEATYLRECLQKIPEEKRVYPQFDPEKEVEKW